MVANSGYSFTLYPYGSVLDDVVPDAIGLANEQMVVVTTADTRA